MKLATRGDKPHLGTNQGVLAPAAKGAKGGASASTYLHILVQYLKIARCDGT